MRDIAPLWSSMFLIYRNLKTFIATFPFQSLFWFCQDFADFALPRRPGGKKMKSTEMSGTRNQPETLSNAGLPGWPCHLVNGLDGWLKKVIQLSTAKRWPSPSDNFIIVNHFSINVTQTEEIRYVPKKAPIVDRISTIYKTKVYVAPCFHYFQTF